MKMTGMCAKSRAFLMRRQVSNPSILGITASMRMRSGRTCGSSERAVAPLRAISAVMPAPSRISVRRRSVSGASSTASTIGEARDSGDMERQRLDRISIALEVAVLGKAPQMGEGGRGRRLRGADLIETRQDPAHVTDAAELLEPDQVRRRRYLLC